MAAEADVEQGHPWPLFDLRLRTSRLELRYRLTLDHWRSRMRPPVEVSGLEAALDLFGVGRSTDA